ISRCSTSSQKRESDSTERIRPGRFVSTWKVWWSAIAMTANTRAMNWSGTSLWNRSDSELTKIRRGVAHFFDSGSSSVLTPRSSMLSNRLGNPLDGANRFTSVSAGCDYCYAETLVHRFAPSKGFPNRFDNMLLRGVKTLLLPLSKKWATPRRIFVNSLSDLFHKDVPDQFIARVFAVMALADH